MSELQSVFTWITNNGISTALLVVIIWLLYKLCVSALDIARQAILGEGGYVESNRNAAQATIQLADHIKEFDRRQMDMCKQHDKSIVNLTTNLTTAHELTHEKLDTVIISILEACEGIKEAATFVQPELQEIFKQYTKRIESNLGR